MEGMNEKIRRLRKEKGLSQSEVAKACGINQASYSNIEKGETKSISIEVGKGIAQTLGVSFNELFDIDLYMADQAIKWLEEKNQMLQKEHDKLMKQLEDYQLLVDFLKDKKMITSPQENIDNQKDFSPGGDDYLKAYIETLDEENKRIMAEIQANPILRKYLEDGTITTGRHYHVWKEYIENK